MTAFDATRMVEERSRAILLPFIECHTAYGYVLTDKGPLARAFQEQVGDVLFNSSDGKMFSAELKAEKTHTGNLFLETWSNRNLDSVASHKERGSNPGWLLKLRADLLLYHFLDTGVLYILPMFKLQQWAFGTSKSQARIYDFPERGQGKYVQHNDTHGRLVPLAVLKQAGLVKVFYPQQCEMFPEEAA